MKTIKTSIFYLLTYTLLLGIVYPTIVAGIGQLFFYENAVGSPVTKDSKVIGSRLIGQEFKEAKYFFSRPSAISSGAYNPESSSGSNVSLTNPAFRQQLQERSSALGSNDPVPIDLVTASGSGLDPEISVAAARYQVRRIATERGISEQKIQMLISEFSEDRLLGVLGEPRVNVLILNMKLDAL